MKLIEVYRTHNNQRLKAKVIFENKKYILCISKNKQNLISGNKFAFYPTKIDFEWQTCEIKFLKDNYSWDIKLNKGE